MRRSLGFAVFFLAATAAAADALRLAAEALERDDFAGAIPHLEAALEDDPGNANARFNLAYAYQSEGDDASAIRHYALIARAEPHLAAARQNLAALLMRAGRFAEAAAEYEALAQLLPPDASLLLLLAAAQREAGATDESAAAFARALDLDGSSLDALQGLASLLADAGRLREAVPYYLRAAALDAGLAEALPSIAARLRQEGATREALDLYRRYARSRPEDAAVQEEIGILLLEEGDAGAAARALVRAVAAEPRGERHTALAEAYRRTGDEAAAREQLRLAAAAAPGDAGARFRYASALLGIREYEQAAREYLAACEADPAARDAWNGLAFALFQLEDFAASLRALRQAEGLGPPRAASVYLKALCLDKLQQYEGARDAYRAFLSLDAGLQEEAWKAEQRLKTIERVLRQR